MSELEDFRQSYFENLKKEEQEELLKNSDLIIAFKTYMQKLGIELSDENFNYVRTIGIIATYPNIISYLHPSLIADKEGLFDFKILTQNFEKKEFMNGYLYADNFMLMAHTYFRRGFYENNHYAPRFIEMFWNYTNSEIEPYMSLDLDRVRINVDNRAYFELDTWFGAQFNNTIELIPDGISKLRPPMDVDESNISFFFNDAYSLDIKWSTKENIKTFQAEEFKTDKIKLPKDEIEYYPVRYIHAEYDLDKKIFRHFDGAIHLYTELEYLNRRDTDFNHNSKNSSHIKSSSQKLYKMNGKINVETWIEFTSHFFTGNPLIIEYFEGRYPKPIIEILEKIRSKNNK